MQAKACFLKHELSRINHELTINGWRGFLFLAESVENAEYTLNFQLSTFNNL